MLNTESRDESAQDVRTRQLHGIWTMAELKQKGDSSDLTLAGLVKMVHWSEDRFNGSAKRLNVGLACGKTASVFIYPKQVEADPEALPEPGDYIFMKSGKSYTKGAGVHLNLSRKTCVMVMRGDLVMGLKNSSFEVNLPLIHCELMESHRFYTVMLLEMESEGSTRGLITREQPGSASAEQSYSVPPDFKTHSTSRADTPKTLAQISQLLQSQPTGGPINVECVRVRVALRRDNPKHIAYMLEDDTLEKIWLDIFTPDRRPDLHELPVNKWLIMRNVRAAMVNGRLKLKTDGGIDNLRWAPETPEIAEPEDDGTPATEQTEFIYDSTLEPVPVLH